MSAPGPTETKTPLWLLIVVGALAAVAIVVAWGARLSWGLWQDETQVAWQAEGGWTIVRDKLGDPAQSVLFGYLEALFYFPGSPRMELWLRLPAVLGGIASGLLAYRLAERLVGKGTGLMAFVAMIGSPEMIELATQARPYTWAVAACLASLLGLARWLETGRRRDGLLFAIASALVVHLHLLFATFAVVPAFFVLRRARRGQPVDWRGLLGWLGLTALLLMPLLVLLRRVSQGPDPSAVGLASLGDASPADPQHRAVSDPVRVRAGGAQPRRGDRGPRCGHRGGPGCRCGASGRAGPRAGRSWPYSGCWHRPCCCSRSRTSATRRFTSIATSSRRSRRRR